MGVVPSPIAATAAPATATRDYPADAQRVEAWEADNCGSATRFFHGSRRSQDGCNIWISGTQHVDGSVSRWATIMADGETDYTADSLRLLAVLAIDAADELDRLNAG